VAEGDDQPLRLSGARLGFVLAVVLLNTLSLGIVSPVLPILVRQLAHGEVTRAAEAIGLFSAAWAAMQILFSPVLGMLSDRFGRRPVLLLAMLDLSADYVIMALAPTLGWLFVGRLLSGMASAGRAAMFAYVSDVAAPEERTRYYGLLLGVGAVGTVLGPGVGGLLGVIGPRAPFWAAAAVGLFNAAYGFVVLRESLPRARRSPFSWARANPFVALGVLTETKGVAGLAAIMVLTNIGLTAFSSLYVLYVNYRYHWGPGAAGLVLMAYAAASVVAQAFLAGPADRRLGDRGAVVTALAFGAAGMALVGLAVWPPLLWLGVIAIAPVNIAFAAVQSLYSRLVAPSEQGRVQGAMLSLTGVAIIIGPIVFAEIFAWSAGPGRGLRLPGLAMLGGGGVFLLAMALALMFISPKIRTGEDQSSERVGGA
jgi:MFS transporter, DHA1 family, tetracycline resistance protein